jgi:hypothetical protein
MIIILLLAFIGFTLDKINFYKLPWNIDTALVLLLFLEVGYLFKSSIQYDVKAVAYVMALMIGILLICINTNVDFDGNEYGNIILMIFGALFVDMPILGISKKIYECKILQFYGKHTLFIMGFDYLSGHISDIILNKINFDNWFSLFILKLVILTIGVVIWNFIVSLIPNNKIKKLLKY